MGQKHSRPFRWSYDFYKTSPNRWLSAFAMGLFVVALLAACGESPSRLSEKEQRVQSSANLVSGTKSDAPIAGLKKGMAYADLRSAVTRDGWTPVVDAECKANVIGSDYSKLCSTQPGLDDCRVCQDLPELGSCSGDGYCGMTFKRKEQILDVTAYGMIEDRFVKGTESRLQVMGWKVQGAQP